MHFKQTERLLVQSAARLNGSAVRLARLRAASPPARGARSAVAEALLRPVSFRVLFPWDLESVPMRGNDVFIVTVYWLQGQRSAGFLMS